MTRLLAIVTILAAAERVSAAAPLTAPSPRSTAPLELVLFGDGKAARVQIRVEVDGKPVSAIWDQTFARLHAYFDRNADGVLDTTEAALLPSTIALRHAMSSGFTPPVGASPAFADLDGDSDGKVTPAELARFYRRAGAGNAHIGVGRLPVSAELTDALLKHLDTNGDGKVTEKEWLAAADVLKKLDKNDDELIGVGELVPKAVYPGAAGTTLLTPPSADRPIPEALAKVPMILLPTDAGDVHWAATVVGRLDRDGDGHLTAAEAGFDTATFARLDADHDGKLTAAELTAWRDQEPDGRWIVRLNGPKTGVDRFVFAGQRLRFEGWATAGKMPEATATARRQMTALLTSAADDGDGMEITRPRRGSLSWLTPLADRDGDKKLDRKELDAWLDLQDQISSGQVLLTVLDGGTGLFELLDTNHDGALSVRELRRAWKNLQAVGCLTDGALDRNKLPRSLLAAASRGYPESFGTDLRGGPSWFRAMDRNGDGDVSRREFTGPPNVFDKLDTDGDGLIDTDEANKAPGRK
ncbi:EF-hand domain-containing protein [Fimbriiglobus ruber]|uniref:EF-hand domain-containing protein n=1 Tax=Fimbriiglobus ruber TaxID=1908690 RepID=A0A225E443_9BACT|nr:EF-hand domain-containing protein [Fimbriiglobus ruber]OWK46524.1 hypothetical protein FRUB_00223 [Fimbriiglobus ruber]